jgi:CheY-like chemotaxis protein/HPt (histidine-containing phosphotransfer) domain-containing protein
VALGLLEKLGYAADVVDNGREGLEMLDRGSYDAVLMDCLMPEMDGFEATVELRRREAESGQARTPVIALTASALESDRQRCAQAGMDDFLTKPIQGHNLRATLDRWLHANDATTRAEPASGMVVSRAETPPAAGITIDLDVIRPIFELQGQGQDGLFDELLALFRTDGEAHLAELQEAVTAGEAHRVERIAHTLRGEALAWGAAMLARRCEQIEASTHDHAGAPEANGTGADPAIVTDLGQLFQSTVAALEAIRAKSA